MKLFFTITKKRLFVLLVAVIILFSVAVWGSGLKVSYIDGSTHAKRMFYINSLNVEVSEEEFTSKKTVIPQKFGNVYVKYNNLQKEAGFDLSDYKGKNITVYSYPTADGEKILTLLVHEGKIIGGDIAETKIDGEMKSLRK